MNREKVSFALNRSLTRRGALQLAGAAGLVALAGPRLTLAQEAAIDELPELRIVAVEYAFELPAEVTAGWTRVTLDNQGTMDHHVMLLRVHDHATPVDLLTALETPNLGAIFPLAESVGGAAVGPGGSSTVLIDLAPGSYVAVCVIPDDDGVPHYVKGQQAPFTVVEGDAAGETPAADLRVELIEMAFDDLPAEFAAGEQLWEVANTGEQLHELAVLRLADGMTIEQGMQIFGIGAPPADATADAPAESSPAMEMHGPPFVSIGGVAPLNPGRTNYLALDLQPGNYIAICFVPDLATGMPHFMLGMIAGFAVA